MSVYFFQGKHTKVIKIGRTTQDIQTRINQVQSADALICLKVQQTPNDAAAEAAYHHQFKSSWSHGEWFNPTPELLAFIESLPSSADDGLEQAVNNNALNTSRADDESDDLDNEPESEESEDEPRNPSSKPKYYRGKSFKSQFKTLVRQIDESVDSDIPAEKRADLIIKKADLFIHLSERGFPRAVPFIAPSFPNSPDTAEIGQKTEIGQS